MKAVPLSVFCCQYVLRVVVLKMKILQNRTVSVISAPFSKRRGANVTIFVKGVPASKGWERMA